MATVIGIFENQYENRKSLTVVKPGTQTRRLLILMTLYKFVMKLLKRISASIIVLVIKTLIQY